MLPFLLAAAATPLGGRTQPHLVMMVVDDLGWADVGYHGSNFATPNIDALALDGAKLERYYVQQVCSPHVRHS